MYVDVKMTVLKIQYKKSYTMRWDNEWTMKETGSQSTMLWIQYTSQGATKSYLVKFCALTRIMYNKGYVKWFFSLNILS